MLARKGSQLTSYVEEGHFNETATFSQEDGFRVAVGLVDYGSKYYADGPEENQFIDPTEYLEVYATLSDLDETKNIPIKSENCTKADLGLVPGTPSTKFYPLKESQKEPTSEIIDIGSFICFDLGSHKLMGDLKSTLLQEFQIDIKIKDQEGEGSIYDCSNTEADSLYCEPSYEFLKRTAGVSVVTLVNQKRYRPESYDSSGPIVSQSELTWYDIPSRALKRVFQVEQQSLEYDDNYFMAISGVTDKNIDFFHVHEYATSTQTYEFRTLLMLDYHMNLDLISHSRSVFTFVGVLGEVGGLYGLLISVASTCLSYATFQRAENYLVSQLYHSKTEDANLNP